MATIKDLLSNIISKIHTKMDAPTVTEADNGKVLGVVDGAVGLVEQGSGLPEGGEPYKALVTDGEGKWVAEERLAWRKKEIKKILSEETLVFAENMAQIANDELLSVVNTEGAELGVTWDGKLYNCVSMVFNGQAHIAGNLYKFLESQGMNPGDAGLTQDTGEPFLLLAQGDIVIAAVFDSETTSATVSITAAAFVYTPIDSNYLPLVSSEAAGAVKVYNFQYYNALVDDMIAAVQDYRSGVARIFWLGAELIGAFIKEETIDGTAKKVLYARKVSALPLFCRWIEDKGAFNETLREYVYDGSDRYIFSASGKRFRIIVSDDGTLSTVEG